MYININEPKNEISPDAVKVWRMSNTIGHIIALVIVAILFICANLFDWYDWISIVLYCLGGLAILSGIYSILIEPIYLQRTWRYEIDQEFIQLKHGRWNQQHILIPMEKVEYVRTEQGPIMRRHKLYNIEVGTSTSNHVIPAIPAEEAHLLKAQIATFAKIKDPENGEGEKEHATNN